MTSNTRPHPEDDDDDDTTLIPPSPPPPYDPYVHHDGFPSERTEQTDIFPLICILICISFILFIIIIVIIINNIGAIDARDISRIPLNYELSLKRLYPFNYRFDYVINGIPTIDSLIYINSNFTNMTSSLVLAELISRSLIIIPPGWYEVQEFRYNTNRTFVRRVLTTKCRLEFTVSSIWSAPNIIIQFTTFPMSNFTREFTLQESMKFCKWKITWTFIMNGYIHKLCPKDLKISNSNKNESIFDSQGYEKVAYFKGWEFLGFTFLSLDSKINYGYTTVPNILNMMSRSVYITKDAPFPPIIPTIYTAYYNYIISSRSGHRRNGQK